ncbi:MAG: hypothetical protein JXR76_14065 [Deltaproteobacteria bacterium]|nr:hypothetical protein [Deltaproteobacteria bacterium]
MKPPEHAYKIGSCIWALAALTVIFTAGALAGTDWEEEKITRDGIFVYSRNTAGTTIREVRAKMTVDAPPAVVLEAACDPKTFKDTIDKYVKKNAYYKVGDPNVWYNYQLLDFPVVAKRDYCLRYEKTVIPEKSIYELRWQVSNRFGPPPQKDVVRVTLVKGRLSVKPTKNGKGSIFRYTMVADPGGKIPDWIINLANRTSLPNILREIRDASLKKAKSQTTLLSTAK